MSLRNNAAFQKALTIKEYGSMDVGCKNGDLGFLLESSLSGFLPVIQSICFCAAVNVHCQGYGADAKVDVASATLRLAPGPEAAARGLAEGRTSGCMGLGFRVYRVGVHRLGGP